MKIKFYILFFLLCYQYLLFSQKDGDSLVLFSELKYHSEFEKEAIQSYVQSNSDTLNLFLAIDSSMTEELAIKYNALYRTMISELLVKKIDSKKIIKRVRKSFTMLHNKYLEKYNEIEIDDNYGFGSPEALYDTIDDSSYFENQVLTSDKAPFRQGEELHSSISITEYCK